MDCIKLSKRRNKCRNKCRNKMKSPHLKKLGLF